MFIIRMLWHGVRNYILVFFLYASENLCIYLPHNSFNFSINEINSFFIILNLRVHFLIWASSN